jgi:hypothetical protein
MTAGGIPRDFAERRLRRLPRMSGETSLRGFGQVIQRHGGRFFEVSEHMPEDGRNQLSPPPGLVTGEDFTSD